MTQIATFTRSEVSNWLIQNGFGSHVDVFTSCEVDGALLVEMTAQELIDDLGFTAAEANNLLLAVQRSKAASSYTPSPAAMGTYVPSAAATVPSTFAAPDPRLQTLENENNDLKHQNAYLQNENARLQGEVQHWQAMYNQLVQQQQPQAIPQPMPTYIAPTQQATPVYATPPPQPVTPTYSPVPPYPAQTGYQPQQQTTTTTTPAQTTPPTQNHPHTGINVAAGAGVGALKGATMGAIAGAILPNMDASDGAKAGAAMGALGGGVGGLRKGGGLKKLLR